MPAIGPFDVSRQGYGCMGLSHSYGRADDEDSVRTLNRALDLGVTLFDPANVYAQGHNESLVGPALVHARGRSTLTVTSS